MSNEEHVSGDYQVEMEHIKKSFGGVKALKDVTFQVKKAEIHSLCGENGAGKSTLMKVLSGAHQKDSGKIWINGNEIEIDNPKAGQKHGIGIIYQEFALAPDLTVAENIFIDNLSQGKFLVDKNILCEKSKKILDKLGFDIDPHTLVGNLSVALQQVVEIAKALSKNIKVLILDEPSAVLTPPEVRKLFEVIYKLRDHGVSIIYISHRMDEVFEISDRITVIKDGETVGTVNVSDVDHDDIIRMMIGRTLSQMFPERNVEIGDTIFEVKNLNRKGIIKNINFSIKEGEVVGLSGLVGCGRTEVARAIFGADPIDSGELYLRGKKLNIKSPKDAVKQKVGLVPENRKDQGVILSMSIKHNSTMASLKKIRKFFDVIHRKKEELIVERLRDKLKIKTDTIENPVANLSGGNQQKVVLAKWISADCDLIIFDEPTRGVDVGAKVEIYNLINDLAKKGHALLVISSELMEIIGVCDRTLVMHNGQITGELGKNELSEESIMKLAVKKVD
jgi:ribose transport system ATP-binding protein